MRILFITSTLEPKDGWGRHSLGVVNEISQNNQVVVACQHHYADSQTDQKQILHSTHSIVSPFKIFLTRNKLQKVIDEFKPDVVHFLVEPYVVVLQFLKISRKTKTFLTVHGTYSFIPYLFIREKIKSWISGILIKKSYEKLTGIISVSSYTKEHLLNQYLDFYKTELPSSKITVIPNGIDTSKFTFEVVTKSHDKKTILFVGAIKKRKGVLEALSAIASYKNSWGDDFTFIIAGSYSDTDPYAKQVKLKIESLGLQANVQMTGFVDDLELEKLYKNADLFLMLSVEDGVSVEGFGLVYLEANAYGVPVIGSTNSGARDAVVPGVTGFLVNPFDSSDVAGKIRQVFSGEIKQEDCLSWARKQDIKSKTEILFNLYKS